MSCAQESGELSDWGQSVSVSAASEGSGVDDDNKRASSSSSKSASASSLPAAVLLTAQSETKLSTTTSNSSSSSNIEARIAYDDLREWLARAELLGEVRVVKGASWQEDIGLAAEAILRAENGPCVVFDEVPATVSDAAGVSVSPTVKLMAGVAMSSFVVLSVTSEMVGGLFPAEVLNTTSTQ